MNYRSRGFNGRCNRNRHRYNQSVINNYKKEFNYNRTYIKPNQFVTYYEKNEKKYFDKVQDLKEKENGMNLKISEIRNKIQKELNSRRDIIKNYNLHDEECFIITDDKDYSRLKKAFIVFLVQKQNSNYLKKKLFEKKLKRIKFSLDTTSSDLFIQNEFQFSKKKQWKSILNSNAAKWEEWKKILHFISRNISKFKINIKKKNLNELSKKFEQITLLRKEKKQSICENCGSKNSKDALFCHYCGIKL